MKKIENSEWRRKKLGRKLWVRIREKEANAYRRNQWV